MGPCWLKVPTILCHLKPVDNITVHHSNILKDSLVNKLDMLVYSEFKYSVELLSCKYFVNHWSDQRGDFSVLAPPLPYRDIYMRVTPQSIWIHCSGRIVFSQLFHCCRSWQIGNRKQSLKLHWIFKQLKNSKTTSEGVNGKHYIYANAIDYTNHM